MNQHHRDRRKIDPMREPASRRTGDDGVEIGPMRLALAEWDKAGLELPDLERMRRHRWERLTRHVAGRG